MAFPTTSVLTNFTGTDEDPLSETATWSGPSQSGVNRGRRLSNAFAPSTTGTNHQSYRTAVSAANVESYTTITVVGAGSDSYAAWGRIKNPGNASTATSYLGVYTIGTGWRLFKLTGGSSYSQLGSTLNSNAPILNDKIGLEVNGTSVTVYHFTGGSWASRVTVTDSAVAGAGTVGLELGANGGGGLRFDDFGGGAILAAPANTVAPAVTGTAQVGQTLACTTGTWTNTPTSYAYQWKWSDGTSATGTGNATNSYTVDGTDLGKQLKCVVTATNASGSTAQDSNTTAAVIVAAPTNSVAPAVTGTAQVAQVLSCTTGTWTGSPTFAYQWKWSGGASASGTGNATSSYTVDVTDLGQQLKCTVTATNAGGSTAQDSNTTAAVTAAATSGAASLLLLGVG